MQKLILAGALIAAGALSSEGVVHAHGGTYRGPGDTVPPVGTGGGGGGPAGSPQPVGPSEPGSTPTTGGTAVPGLPGLGPAGQAGIATGGDSNGGDLEAWQFWWGFNKEPYLDLKAAIHSDAPQTHTDLFYIGRGETEIALDRRRPTEAKVRASIVPELLAALERERHDDIVTGCLVALARIGDVEDERGESPFEAVIRRFLADPSQEVSETAAVSLGILANDASIPTLTALAADAPDGRALVGTTEVPYRTRAFAAYGLGLIGARAADDATRRRIVQTLIELLGTPETATRDLHVAALIALGLVPLDAAPARPAAEDGEPLRDAAYFASSRASQLEFLLEFFADRTGRHYLVRAHAPRAMAALLAPHDAEPLSDAALRERVARALIAAAGRHSKERNEVVQGAVLAMGRIADLDDDPVDVALRDVLLERVDSSGEGQSNRFALIALAQLCARQGSGEGAEAAYEDVAGRMTRWLARTGGGKSRLKPWIGLALGVMQRARTDAGLPAGRAAGQALRSSLADCAVPTDVGAYCIGAGIARDLEARSLVADKLEHMADDEARGYAALALGLMGANDRIETIQRIVRESQYRPDLLKQAAIALGLLGDKRLVPDLVAMLGEAKSLSTQAAIASALGFIGDARSIDPLVEMLRNEEISGSARGFAAVALGIVADKEALPWNSKISTDINYRANTTTLTGQTGTGILDIL